MSCTPSRYRSAPTRSAAVSSGTAAATTHTPTIAIYESGRAPRIATLDEIDRLLADKAELVAALETLFIAAGSAGGNSERSPFRGLWLIARAALTKAKQE